MTIDSGLPCPLCGRQGAPRILYDAGRAYHRCTQCDLIFVASEHRPAPLTEVMRYLEHDNDRDDPEYLRFLRRLADPLCRRVPRGARGLDFGCGPVPVLAEWLTTQGRPTAAYDPLFHPDEHLLEQRFDFVTCTEVAEHAHDPAAMFGRLGSLLHPSGTLAVMTRFHPGDAPFAAWWYRRDITHVCFYDAVTMRWIAAHHGWSLELPVPDVALFAAPA